MDKINTLPNKLCLRPYNKEKQAIFFRFRCEDVAVMSSYFIVTQGVNLCSNIYQFYNTPSKIAFIQLLPFIVLFILRIVTWLVRNRFTLKLGYIFVAVFFLEMAVNVFGTPIENI